MALTTVSSDRLSTNVKNTNFTAAEKQDLTNDILPLASQFGKSKNLIINGAMQVAQRGTTSTASTYGTVDRFRIVNSGTDEAAFTQKQVTDSPDGFGNSYEIDITTAESALAADEYFLIRTILEANTLQSLAFGTSSAKQITLSFYVKAYQTGTYAANIYSDDSARAYTVNYTINQSATWERKSITFSGDTVGAITNNNGVGFFINWFLAAGRNYTSSTAFKNQWASFANAGWAHGQAVNVLSSTDNYWKITGVQLELDSVATEFEHRSFGDELARCQRYFCKMKAYAGASNGWIIQYPVTMRSAPSATVNSGTIGSVNQITTSTSNWNLSGGSANMAECFYSAEL